MTEQEMDAVDNHLETFSAASPEAGMSGDSLTVFNIGQIWAEVRPVVMAIHNFFLTPKKWKAAMQKLIDFLDGLFPQS